MNKFSRSLVAWFAGAFTVLALQACSPGDPDTSQVTLAPIPAIELGSMSPAVRKQFEKQQAELEASPRDVDANERFAKLLHAYGQLAPAIVMYERCSALRPKQLDCTYLRSLALKTQGDHRESLALLESLKGDGRRYPRLPILLADSYRQLGRDQDAIDMLRKFTERNPRIPEALFGLAQSLIATGNYEEAKEHLLKIHETGANYGPVHSSLANVFRQQRNMQQAAVHVEAAQRHSGSSVPIIDDTMRAVYDMRVDDEQFVRQAAVMFKKGDYAEAKRLFLSSLVIEPDNAETHANLVGVFAALGDLSNAELHFEKSRAVDANLLLAYRNMGTAYMNFGKFKEAQTTFSQLLDLEPDDADARARRAYSALLQGNTVDPTEYQIALEDNPENPLANFLLGYHYKEQGNCAAGIPYLEKSLRPDDVTTVTFFADLVRCYAAEKRFDDAKRTYQAAKEIALKLDNKSALTDLASVENDIPEVR